MKWISCLAFSLLTASPLAAAPATRPSVMEYQNFAMTHQGEAARRNELFFAEQRLGCRRDEAGTLYLVGYEGTIYQMDLGQTQFER